ncbi:MAG TPA: hypothetical protein VGH33_26650 [Isosphaeraceae bacterium]|jgi:hypothetical protein
MSLLQGMTPPSLIALVEERIRQSTHNRIRNLSVAEVEGRLVVAGQVSSHHTKQLAHHGALELLSCDQFASEIIVFSDPPGRRMDV